MFRRRVAPFIVTLLTATSLAEPARADWFFGLFGDSEAPPAPQPGVAAYALDIEVADKALAQTLQDASNLYRLRQNPPDSGEGLARRAAADLPRLVDALWAEGYYDASVSAVLEGKRIAIGGAGLDAASDAAERIIGQRIVQARLEVVLGDRYRIGAIRIVSAATGQPVDPDLNRPNLLKLESGDPARANAIRDMQARLVDALRAKGFPLAKVASAEAIIRHRPQEVDLLLRVEPGAKAGFGAVSITGTQDLDPAVVRSFIYVEPGEPYSPAKIAAMRKSMAQIEAIGSTRILEADHFDADGALPITVQVDERKQHAISAAAQYSTVDGPSVRADWTARNLFGGGERLRLSGVLGMDAEPSQKYDLGSLFDARRLIGRVSAGFIKPALDGSRNDYLADVTLAREATSSYTAEYFNTAHVIRHRFDETLSVQSGVEVERGGSSDSFGGANYLLVGVTAALRYDDTDNPLDPKRGARMFVSAEAFPRAFGSSINLFEGKAQASTYYSLDEDSQYIIAGRVALGAEGGANILDIPDNRRFFVGGGGSVRGFGYRSLSPLGPNGAPMGGLSMFESSLEARVKVTDTIGVVPFVDAGAAYATAFPNFQQDMRFAYGLGLRYFTGFGPIRLDVATPVGRRSGEAALAFYVGIGQAF